MITIYSMKNNMMMTFHHIEKAKDQIKGLLKDMDLKVILTNKSTIPRIINILNIIMIPAIIIMISGKLIMTKIQWP